MLGLGASKQGFRQPWVLAVGAVGLVGLVWLALNAARPSTLDRSTATLMAEVSDLARSMSTVCNARLARCCLLVLTTVIARTGFLDQLRADVDTLRPQLAEVGCFIECAHHRGGS